MPLSDLFKKSSKPQPSGRSSQDEAFGSPALQKNRADAAAEVMGIFDRNGVQINWTNPGSNDKLLAALKHGQADIAVASANHVIKSSGA